MNIIIAKSDYFSETKNLSKNNHLRKKWASDQFKYALQIWPLLKKMEFLQFYDKSVCISYQRASAEVFPLNSEYKDNIICSWKLPSEKVPFIGKKRPGILADICYLQLLSTPVWKNWKLEKLVCGFFAVGQFTVKKNSVRLN